jgi:mono/diheme cytochrome c family protein
MVRRLIIAGAFGLVAAAPAAAADGAAIYKEQCAKCHGDTGNADTTIGKAMKVPPLTGDAEVAKMSASEVTAAVTANEKHPPTVKGLSAEDLAAASAYAKTLAAGGK